MRIIAILASLPCLALTGSRTFWIAGLAALCAASLRYVRWNLIHVSVGALILVIAVCVGIAADVRVTAQQQAMLFRQGSIDTFSGRTSIWTQALQQYWEAPWVGHGFTAGGLTLDRESHGLSAVASSLQAPLQGSVTLHNGYVQALLDSGGIGALLYAALIMIALVCYVRHDRERRYAAEFYCLLFLAIANLGETVIFGAAVLHGVWFWYVTVLALTLPSLTRKRTEPCVDLVADDGRDQQDGSRPPDAMPVPARRYPIVQSKEVWS